MEQAADITLDNLLAETTTSECDERVVELFSRSNCPQIAPSPMRGFFMFDKFLEAQAKRFISDSRVKFEEFLSTNDVDNNGEKDRQQLLQDFDEFTNGMHECIKSGASVAGLLAAYYNKFGPKEEPTQQIADANSSKSENLVAKNSVH